jgi:hypothetical protein
MAKPPRERRPPLALTDVRTYPLASRKSKVSVADFGRPHVAGASFASFVDGLPGILGSETLRRLAADILRARALDKPTLWGLGAHVLKVGLSPVIIDLMEKGLVTGLALNGAGIVHDFELAVAGQTSEEVDDGLGSGAFGMARETGEEVNRAIVEGDRDGLGLGAAVGRYLTVARPAHLELSLLAAAHRLGLPATVHVAVGTDIVHMHPACDPGAVGRATHLDFRTFAAEVAALGGGGVYLNVGSAVLLPEVFLKAVTLARNLGHELRDFATANLDFLQGYRPNTNVVQRPTKGVGRGYSLTGHHEILVSLLAAMLVEGVARDARSEREERPTSQARWLGIDFSGDVDKWSPTCGASNVWVAELILDRDLPRLNSLRRVQEIEGQGTPFERLCGLLREGNYAAAAIDAPFSVPAGRVPDGSHEALLKAVVQWERAGRPFAKGETLVSQLAPETGRRGRKEFRHTETLWGLSGVRSPMWDGPLGGSAMTVTCLTLLAQARRPIWPWFPSTTGGLLAEAFPAAQLKAWHLPHQKYNGNDRVAHENRKRILKGLEGRCSFSAADKQVMLDSADALDALLCAFAARAVSGGVVLRQPPEEPTSEGWIAVHS